MKTKGKPKNFPTVPVIERNPENTVLLGHLRRSGVINGFDIDWKKIKEDLESEALLYCFGIGDKRIKIIRGWLENVQLNYPELLEQHAAEHRVVLDAVTPSQVGALCPHCGNPIQLVKPETPRR